MTLGKPKVIGIVGGMGPQAGIALYERITNKTPATNDQGHLPVVLMSFPGSIVDRTRFLEGKITTNPADAIVDVIRKLAASGAQVIGIACNTSHAPPIFDVIESAVERLETRPTLVNMPQEVCNHIARHYSQRSRIGLMATNGTYRSGLYDAMLEARGYEMVTPDSRFQKEVIHRMIYDPKIGIKANRSITAEALRLYDEALSFFRKRGVGAIILGCTELSLIPSHWLGEVPVVDSTECLASALIEASGRTVAGAPVVTSFSKSVAVANKF